MNRNIVVIVSDGENSPALLPDEFERLVSLATRFKSAGGTIACVGVRAAGAGFRLLRGLATPGFFVNVFGGNAEVASARASLLGSLGQLCASTVLSFPPAQFEDDKPLPSLEIFGNVPPSLACRKPKPGSVTSASPGFLGLGGLDPFFGTSFYKMNDPFPVANSTMLTWTLPDLSEEASVHNILNVDVTLYFSDTNNISTAKTLVIPASGRVYLAATLYFWGVTNPVSQYSASQLAGISSTLLTSLSLHLYVNIFNSLGTGSRLAFHNE